MAKVLVRDEWFELVSPTMLYEADFESQIVARAAKLFPNWHLVRFKRDVRAPGLGVARPDLALVDPEYRTWWVVEVEMGRHSLSDHVEQQVMLLANGRYDGEHAAAIAAATQGTLDAARLTALVCGMQPRVFVLADAERPGWRRAIEQHEGLLGFVEVYQSRNGHFVFRVLGDVPSVETAHLTKCEFAKLFPRALRLENPAVLALAPDDKVEIEYEGGATTWIFKPLGPNGYLFSAGRFPFDQGTRELLLVRRADGRLAFQLTSGRRRER